MLVIAFSACRAPVRLAPLVLPAGVADSVITTAVASGVRLHTVVNLAAPWRAYVLQAATRCVRLEAVKGKPTAVGRTATSAILAALPNAATSEAHAIAAVNADFFLPNGVPTNAHIENGRLLSGPDRRPVAFSAQDAGGRAQRWRFDTLRAEGALVGPKARVELRAWNRPSARINGVVDAAWGAPLDSLIRRRTVKLVPVVPPTHSPGPSLGGRYVVHALSAADSTARADTLFAHIDAAEHREGARVSTGDTVEVSLRVAIGADNGTGLNAAIDQAVGGRPMLLADSRVLGDVDTEGNAGFRGLNPRTLMGLDQRASTVWLVVVDGRRPGHSVGMTLRQSAELLRALGATKGLNLDGGGSSALAWRYPAASDVRVANRPSDPMERPVANALAVYSTCRER